MKMYPGHRNKEIETSIARAVEYLETIQMPDGSWYGNWGVCFIYSTWFALAGLAAAGKASSSNQAMHRGADFLLRVQSPDGGWGESYLACPNKVVEFISAIELCLDKRANTFIMDQCCASFFRYTHLSKNTDQLMCTQLGLCLV